jgi:thiamine transport system ATP-binding protein
VLSLDGVTVRFDEVAAVDDVSLQVADGQVLALLGPSGCGKSTLLRAVAGIEPPASGRLRWDGVDLRRVPVHRRGFGLMFQDGVLFPHRTVAGNVGYGLRRGPDRVTRVAELLAMVGLAGYGDRSVATLSGGEAQRVALARALAPQPRLLLLDEPLAALDMSLRGALIADLRTVLRASGVTAIFVTHDQSEAFAIADRIALMRRGRIVQVDTPARVWRRPVDAGAARFVGCETILDATPRELPGGGWVSDTPLGAVPGRATAVGIRPSALVTDGDGPLSGTVVAAVPGPERTRLTVRLARAARRGAPDASVSEIARYDGILAGCELPAVAEGGAVPEPGSAVRLHFDPAQVAMIGAG